MIYDETMQGERIMSKKQTQPAVTSLKPHSDAQQKEYEREARLQFGADNVNASVQRWNSYSKAKQDEIMAEAGEVYTDMVEAMKQERLTGPVDVTSILDRWQQNLRYFYEPTLEILRGLGEMYNIDPAFNATFTKFHPDLPAYLQEKITQYVDDLETAELERMLAEDEKRAQRLS
jgi:hypothetical protein